MATVGLQHLLRFHRAEGRGPEQTTLGGHHVGTRMAPGTIRCMAYDEALAERIRELLEDRPGVREKDMFGGLAFLVGGNMAIAASGHGGALVRVDPADSNRIVDTTDAELAVMQGRPMQGWLRVAPEHLRTRRHVAKWVALGAAYARSLPSK